MTEERRQDEDAIPSGIACAGCGYELAGLPREGVCPECGLDVPASWPVWDLRRCAKPYLEHVQDELRMLHWATLAAWAVLAATAMSGMSAALELHDGGTAVAAMVFGLLAITALVPLPLFVGLAGGALARHPNTRTSPGAEERTRLRLALVIAQIGLWAVLGLALLGMFVLPRMSPVPFFAAATIALAGLGWASIEAMSYAQSTLRRASANTGRHGLLLSWGFALSVLAIVATGWMFVDLGRPLLLAAASGALLGPATALAVRVARAMAVVDVMAADKPASDTP